MRADGNAVLSGLTAEETGSRRSSCMPVSQGARTYLRALATIIKRERARENTGGKTQKWQSRSLGPPRVLTSSAKGENVLRPRSVPSTYAFLTHLPLSTISTVVSLSDLFYSVTSFSRWSLAGRLASWREPMIWSKTLVPLEVEILLRMRVSVGFVNL